jgi:hypothetical protein
MSTRTVATIPSGVGRSGVGRHVWTGWGGWEGRGWKSGGCTNAPEGRGRGASARPARPARPAPRPPRPRSTCTSVRTRARAGRLRAMVWRRAARRGRALPRGGAPAAGGRGAGAGRWGGGRRRAQHQGSEGEVRGRRAAARAAAARPPQVPRPFACLPTRLRRTAPANAAPRPASSPSAPADLVPPAPRRHRHSPVSRAGRPPRGESRAWLGSPPRARGGRDRASRAGRSASTRPGWAIRVGPPRDAPPGPWQPPRERGSRSKRDSRAWGPGPALAARATPPRRRRDAHPHAPPAPSPRPSPRSALQSWRASRTPPTRWVARQVPLGARRTGPRLQRAARRAAPPRW